MPWQRVDLVIDGDRAEGLAEALEEHGALSTELTDADADTPREKAVYGEPGSNAGLWPRTRVSALFHARFDTSRALREAFEATGIEPVESTLETIEDANWVALTQQQFEPLHIGRRIWIVPTWFEIPDPAAVNVILDPGPAFGTGSHPTTRLCLAWLEDEVAPGDHVLDYGCGSGILAITALKLGAASAAGVDVDAMALEAARHNASQNGVTLEVFDGERPLERKGRVTVANILANPLRMLAPIICANTQAGGRIALSGVLRDQADDVARAYGAWADMRVHAEDGGWVLLTGTRNDRPC